MLPNMNPARGLSAIRSILRQAKLDLNFTRAEVLDPRITFSRTSNATRTNAQGLIEYAPHNLLTYSENFDSAVWVKGVGVTVTPNAIASPDGAITADLISSPQDQGCYENLLSVGIGITVTNSIYIKAGTATQLLFRDDLGAGRHLVINPSTGQIIGSSGTIVNSGSVNIGNGWYRYYMTYVTDSANCRNWVRNDTAGTLTYYTWGAQLNIGSLQPYYTTSVKNLLGYSQEFSNAVWTKSNSYVLTNLLTYSQEFDNAVWVKTNATVTANAVVAPNGTLSADKLIANTVNTQHLAQHLLTPNAGTKYTLSFYVKAAEYSYCLVGFSGGGLIDDCLLGIDLATGISSSTSGAPESTNIVSIGSNWYRVSITKTLPSASLCGLRVMPSIDGISQIFTGDGTSGLYIWGAQLVQGTDPGEYTVTTSAAAPIQVMGPFGYLGAMKLVENTAASVPHGFAVDINSLNSTTQYTLSIYAKAGERTWVRLGLVDNLGTDGGRAWFDLSNGVVGTVETNGAGSNINATITSIGAGWYRCRFTAQMNNSKTTLQSQVRLATANNVLSYTGDGTSGIYIWGVQLSDSASLDPYSYNTGAAPTSSAYYGPRFDYDPVTLAPKGLLIEEARTNLITYSEQFNDVNWTKSNATVTANAVVAPDGTLSADKLVESAVTGYHYTQTNSNVISAITYTFSVYAKAGEDGFVNIQIGGGLGSSTGVSTNLTTGVQQGYNGASIYSATYIANGWFRISLTVTAGATGVGSVLIVTSKTLSTNATYAGDGTSGIYIWGAQLEQGSFPTSYIPTTSAQVTRTADNASMTGTNFSSWYNQSEGTVLCESLVTGNRVSDYTYWRIDDNTNTNRIQSGTGASVTVGNAFIITNNISQGNNIVNINPTNITKTAFAIAANNTVNSANGTIGTVDTTAALPTVNQLILGRDSTVGYINGGIKSFKYFNKRFINTYLQSLTQ